MRTNGALEPAAHRNAGDVRAPDLVRALHRHRRGAGTGTPCALGAARWSAASGTPPQAHQPHQPADAVPARDRPLAPQVPRHLPAAVEGSPCATRRRAASAPDWTRLRNRKGNSAACLAVVRRLALNIARMHPDRRSIRREFTRAQHADDFLLDMIRRIRKHE